MRIVAVASLGHMFGGFDIDDLHFRHRTYYKLKGYGQSKLCNILFVKELARRYCFLSNQPLLIDSKSKVPCIAAQQVLRTQLIS